MDTLLNNWKKITLLVLSFLVVFCIFNYNFDVQGEEQLDKSFQQAVIVFGSAKALNAVISLAQGTQVDILVFTVAVGEVLDPINDLIEQFSWVMLASMVSLGIQKILINFVNTDVYGYLIVGSLIIFNVWICFISSKYKQFQIVFFKVIVILVFLRFAVPLMGLLSEVTYNSFVKQDYNITQLNEKILEVKENVNSVTTKVVSKKENSVFDNIREKFDKNYYLNQVKEYQEAADNSSEYIVSLIIVFIFQTILFPLIFLFILYQIIKGIFRVKKENYD